MADQWALTTRTIKVNGIEEVAAVLDVKIERRIVFGMGEIESLGPALKLLDMSDVDEALRFVAANKDHAKLINIPWTDAPNGNFDSEGISTFIERAANKVTWRLEGKPETGLSAVVSCAGSEITFNLQRDRVDEVVAKAAENGKKCEEAAQRTQDAGERLVLHAAIGIVGCVGALLPAGAAGAGPAALAAVACYVAYDQWQQEADETNKKAQEDAVERDRLRCGYADTGGGGMGGIRYTRNMD
jgi:hypothetical protein